MRSGSGEPKQDYLCRIRVVGPCSSEQTQDEKPCHKGGDTNEDGLQTPSGFFRRLDRARDDLPEDPEDQRDAEDDEKKNPKDTA